MSDLFGECRLGQYRLGLLNAFALDVSPFDEHRIGFIGDSSE